MKRRMCVRRYMARKVLVYFWKGIPFFLAMCLLFIGIAGIAFLAEKYPPVREVLKLAFLAFFVLMLLWAIVSNAVALYHEARRECGYDQD